jgi:hypothetical protein
MDKWSALPSRRRATPPRRRSAPWRRRKDWFEVRDDELGPKASDSENGDGGARPRRETTKTYMTIA